MTSIDFDLSVIDMILFVIFSVWSGYLTIRQVQWARTSLELDLVNLLGTASREVRVYAVTLSDDPKNEVKAREYESALEDYRSVCEDACEKYIHGKVDRTWFKNMFWSDLQRLVEDKSYVDLYTSPDTRFTNTIQVYREWFNQDPAD